jgi:hypothetical protein
MVRAILEGRKTQTRRVLSQQPAPRFQHLETFRDGTCEVGLSIDSPNHYQIASRYGGVGDRLWVKETFYTSFINDEELKRGFPIYYSADSYGRKKMIGGKTRPSIFMPRWASRILLEIEKIQVQRLSEVSERDAIQEGASFHDGAGVGHSGWRHDPNAGFVFASGLESFAALWDSINEKRGFPWRSNPWVWSISFRKI